MPKAPPTSSAGGGGAGGPRIARKTSGNVAPFTLAASRRASSKQINVKQRGKIDSAVKKGFRS